MANNYLQFCMGFDITHPEQMWLKHILEMVNEEQDDDAPPEEERKLCLELCGLDVEEFAGYGPDIAYQFQENCSPEIPGQTRLSNSVIFQAEEYGRPEAIAKLMHEMLKAFRPSGDDVFTFTWSESCGKMRLDEFTGGIAVATAQGFALENCLKFEGVLLEQIKQKAREQCQPVVN